MNKNVGIATGVGIAIIVGVILFQVNQTMWQQVSVEEYYDKGGKVAGVVYPDNQGFIDFLKYEKSFFVQGNFSPNSMRKEHSEYLSDYQEFVIQMQQLSKNDRKGWLCSLSHGVLPKTPENNVLHFVREIRNTFS